MSTARSLQRFALLATVAGAAYPARASAEMGGPFDDTSILPSGGVPVIFEREPFGFTLDTILGLGESAVGLLRDLLAWFGRWGELTALEVAGQAAPWFIVALFAAALWAGDRHVRARFREWAVQARTADRLKQQLRGPVSALLRFVGRTLAPGVALLLSYVPVRGVYPHDGWSAALSLGMFVFVMARGLGALSTELLWSELVQAPPEVRQRLSYFAVRALNIAAIAFAIDRMLLALGATPELHAVSYFGFRVTLAFLGAWAITRRHDLSAALLPADPARRTELWGLADRLIGWVLSLSVALLVLYAAGFRALALAVLPRSYSVFGLIALAIALRRAVDRWLARSTHRAPNFATRLVTALTDPFATTVTYIALALVAMDLAGLFDPTVALLQRPLFLVGSTPITLYNLLKGTTIIVGSIFLSRLLRILLDALVLTPRKVDEGIAYAITTSVHYLLIVFGIGMALVTAGLDLSAMAVFAGALGVGIGLGLQEITRNTVSGFILLYGGSVKKGDLITVGDKHYGRVWSIGARSVTVHTFDDVDLVVPSSDLVNSTIINWSRRNPYARLRVPVSISYKSDLAVARSAILRAVTQFDRIHKPEEADVWFKGYDESAAHLELVFWLDVCRYARDETYGRVLFYVWQELQAQGIEIPLPRRDVHLAPGLVANSPRHATYSEDSPETRQATQHADQADAIRKSTG